MLSHLPFTLNALREVYAAGTSPLEVVDEIFARLDAVNDPGIFIHLCDRESLRAAAAALGDYDPDKPLWGIPFAVKDNIDVAGIETTAGCPAYAYTPDKDAFVVANLRRAGALMIGKTNLDQFATGLVGVRTPYGAPLNAVDPKIVPGGSSGGSAVIVGHGIVTFSLGTDTAGSGPNELRSRDDPWRDDARRTVEPTQAQFPRRTQSGGAGNTRQSQTRHHLSCAGKTAVLVRPFKDGCYSNLTGSRRRPLDWGDHRVSGLAYTLDSLWRPTDLPTLGAG